LFFFNRDQFFFEKNPEIFLKKMKKFSGIFPGFPEKSESLFTP